MSFFYVYFYVWIKIYDVKMRVLRKKKGGRAKAQPPFLLETSSTTKQF